MVVSHIKWHSELNFSDIANDIFLGRSIMSAAIGWGVRRRRSGGREVLV